MRADAHYVDALMSRSLGGGEEQVAVSAIEPPGEIDEASIGELTESVRRHGILQPLIVQRRKGRHRLIAGRRRLAAAIEAGLSDVPCLIHDVGHEEAKALAEAANVRGDAHGPGPSASFELDAVTQAGALLEESLATLMACSTALAAVTSSLSRTGVTELIRAEAWRASSLAVAARLMRHELAVARTTASIAGVVDRVVDSFGPELRVRGVEVDTEVSPRGLHAAIAPQLVSAILTHGLFLTLAIMDGSIGARARVSATLSDTDELTLAIAQTSVGVPTPWTTRAFDETWGQRPGGNLALISALAVKRGAELMDGRCQLSGSARGTRIQVVLPKD
jgi:ParB/RepB/Spo0J family partition protein